MAGESTTPPAGPAWQRRIFIGAAAGTIALGVLLTVIGERFANKVGEDGASYNVLHFEFMGTPENAREILKVWGADGIAAARLQTWLDFPFLLCYSTAMGLGALAIRRRLPPRHRRFRAAGIPIAGAQWAAGGFDVVENIFLLRVLDGAVDSPNPEIAFVAASVKFALLGIGAVYIAGGWIAGWRGRRRALT